MLQTCPVLGCKHDQHCDSSSLDPSGRVLQFVGRPPWLLVAEMSRARYTAMMLTDSALPTGGFAHSAGLEAAYQQGGVRDRAQLTKWFRRALLQAGHAQLPFAGAVHALLAGADAQRLDGAAAAAALGKWRALDAAAHARARSNHVACRASLSQGSSLLRVGTNWLGDGARGGRADERGAAEGAAAAAAAAADAAGGGAELLSSMVRATRSPSALEAAAGHQAPIFGVLGALLELPRRETLEAYMFCSARDMLSASVRLNLIGPLQALGVQVIMEISKDPCCEICCEFLK